MAAERKRCSCGACCTRIEQLGVRLGSATVLENVSLHMHCGQLTALIGPNGAGKTTLLRAILGEVPHTGALVFTPRGETARRRAPRIGYVPQKLELDAGSPMRVADLFAGARSRWPLWLGVRRGTREEARQNLAVVGADALLDQRLGRLSGGQMQRVLLALAITPVPDILLLDEAVSAVDRAGLDLFYQTVSRLRDAYDLSVLLVSHDLGLVARVADRIVVLNRTVLADGAPESVLADSAARQALGLECAGAAGPFAGQTGPAACCFSESPAKGVS
jgi:zinc transport system ATP-binding protein